MNRGKGRLVLLVVAVASLAFSAPSIASRIADYARNAGKVDGFEASDLLRASSSIAGGHRADFHSRGFANVQRTRFVAPVRGIVVIWSGTSIGWDDDSDPGTYASIAGRIAVDRKAAGPAQRIEISRGTSAGTQGLSLSAAVPVKAGPHRINLQLRTAAGEALTYVHPRHTEWLFVPFGSRGTQGAL